MMCDAMSPCHWRTTPQAWLCNNLLAANWGSAQQLAHVAILGNSFSTYVDRWALRRNDPGRPARLLQCSTEGEAQRVPVLTLGGPVSPGGRVGPCFHWVSVASPLVTCYHRRPHGCV